MRSRQDIVDIFSTYIRFESDRFEGWLADPRLRISMEKRLLQISDQQASEPFFALYWHQHWQAQTHRQATAHLSAHLQESAYWAAYTFSSRFELKQCSLADCFQVSFTKLNKALTSFNPAKGISLSAFAKLFFKSTITNELRRLKEINISSSWLLLRKLTKKQLIEALKSVGGLDEKAVMQYRLLWMCYKQKYAQYREENTHRLANPTASTYENIAALYNKERLSQLPFPTEKIAPTEVEQCLIESAKWARSYLYPSVASLNAPSPGYETGEAQDTLPDSNHLSFIDNALALSAATDRAQQQTALSQTINQAIEQLKSPGEKLLRCYYCEKLKQREIAEALEIKQYAVSRKLNQARSRLLSMLVAQSQQQQKTEALTPEAIERISNALELWLHDGFCRKTTG